MARDKGRLDLREDIYRALKPHVDLPNGTGVVAAVLTAVLPHLELAYKRGQDAAQSRAGYRVVQENERLRRELEQASQLAEARQRVIERMAREALPAAPVNRRVRKVKKEDA
jgi:hypothetical protein